MVPTGLDQFAGESRRCAQPPAPGLLPPRPCTATARTPTTAPTRGLGHSRRRTIRAGRLGAARHGRAGRLRRGPLAARHPGRAGSAAAPADPADRHRQRQHRRHPDPARPGRGPGIVDAVYSGKRSFGFGAAVKSALRQDRRATSGQRDDERTDDDVAPDRSDDSHWLWLLHDDAARRRTRSTGCSPTWPPTRTIDITGPKLLLPRRRQAGQQISEVGVSISGTGRRELQLDPGEIDQGQRDQPHARLGVSTCGMLVRTAVWNDLDGLDPAIPVFRDGVEFGWRAHLNGYRVVTTPSADDHPPPGGPGRSAAPRADRSASGQGGPAARAWWSSPGMRPGRCCRWSGCGWCGAV